MDLYKKEDCIELYDQSEAFADESSYRGTWDTNKRFIMTKENFVQILERWEELRVSRPDTILIVIHEDNHVSLEIDPVIIKEYQDAGYAFDINKIECHMKKWIMFLLSTSCNKRSSFKNIPTARYFLCF